MSEWNMRHCRHSKSRLLFKDRNGVVTHKCVVLVVGERHEGLQTRLPRNEVAGCLIELRVAVDIAKVRGDIKVSL